MQSLGLRIFWRKWYNDDVWLPHFLIHKLISFAKKIIDAFDFRSFEKKCLFIEIFYKKMYFVW